MKRSGGLMQATSVTELVGHNLALAADSAVVAYSAIVPQTSHGVPWLFNVTEWAANGGICHVHHPRCVCPSKVLGRICWSWPIPSHTFQMIPKVKC